MSFLNRYNSEILSARITKRGRNAIAKGNFVISYFQVGDSEYDYSDPFNKISGHGTLPSQKVFSPFDKDCGVKYPYKMDSTDTPTTYGIPVMDSYTETLRNVMGPAGFVSDYKEYDDMECTGTIVECPTVRIDISTINGSSLVTLPVGTGKTFMNCEYITLVFDQFGGTDPDFPIITGQTNSLIYKIDQLVGDVIHLDRDTPDLTSLTGYAQVVCNKCMLEYPIDTKVSDVCVSLPVDPLHQHDPWRLDIVWGENPIGYTGNTNINLSGFTGNQFVSTKQFLGYTKSSGQTDNTQTTYTNCFDEVIYVEPEEQRVLAIIHYSELGDIKNDPERFYKYDDYISNDNDKTSNHSLVEDMDGFPMSDTEYFEVYIPFICYHRNTGTTIGAVFHMDDVEHTITTPANIVDGRSVLPFRYLLDERNYRVGRVFYTNKTIVFDDQELVALLDYRSNRRYTLTAPKTYLVPSDLPPDMSLFSGTTDQTFWISYIFNNTVDPNLNGLPCNYYTRVVGSSTSKMDECSRMMTGSNVAIKFNTGSFNYMRTGLTGVTNGYIATNFQILIQETTPQTRSYPAPDLWRIIDLTSQVTGTTGTTQTYLNPSNIENISFIIRKDDYENAPFFNVEEYIAGGNGYFVHEPSTDPKFGDEQPFPGSVRVVRASDIEVMDFLVNLPSTQFTETQNPTYITGQEKKITDIALLDGNKEPLVVAKMSKPITRVGTQVFAVKLDF